MAKLFLELLSLLSHNINILVTQAHTHIYLTNLRHTQHDYYNNNHGARVSSVLSNSAKTMVMMKNFLVLLLIIHYWKPFSKVNQY